MLIALDLFFDNKKGIYAVAIESVLAAPSLYWFVIFSFARLLVSFQTQAKLVEEYFCLFFIH